MTDKIYKVSDIDFHNQTIEATRTDLSIADVPEDEIFPMEDFREYRVKLINGNNGDTLGEIIDFGEWVSTHGM